MHCITKQGRWQNRITLETFKVPLILNIFVYFYCYCDLVLYGPFCHGSLKNDMSALFISLIYIPRATYVCVNMCVSAETEDLSSNLRKRECRPWMWNTSLHVATDFTLQYYTYEFHCLIYIVNVQTHWNSSPK